MITNLPIRKSERGPDDPPNDGALLAFPFLFFHLVARATSIGRLSQSSELVLETLNKFSGISAPSPQVVPNVTPIMQYLLAPDGEIVKVVEEGYEYTGMYILRN